MSETLLSVRPAFGTWNRGLLHVEYALGVLEEIRRTVLEGFHKIPHGGVETGGLLYGKWDGTILTISAWRPLQCEHPLGPRFQLSGADEAGLATQLATETPELENYQVVGWFASHSRGSLQLRGPDIDLHGKYFVEPWQPILLLCASRNQPMQAAFYCRLDDTVAVGSEVTPFEVVPNPTAVPRRARRVPTASEAAGAKPEAGEAMRILAAQVGSEPAQIAPPEPIASVNPAWVPLEPAVASPWASRGYERVEGPAATIAPSAEPALRSEATSTESPAVTEPAPLHPMWQTRVVEGLDSGIEQGLTTEPAGENHVYVPTFGNLGDDTEEPPKFTSPADNERNFFWKRLAWAALWVGVAAAGIYTIPKFSLPTAAITPGSMAVQLSEVPGAARGQIVVRWDLKGAANAVLRNGEITVVDGAGGRGATVQSFPMAPKELRSGSLTYWPQSEHVDVSVTVQTGRPGSGEAMVGKGSFGPTQPPAKVGADSAALNDLRNQLREQRAHGRELEKQLSLKKR